MGITSLKKLIANNAVRKHLSAYSGKKIAIDASIFLYRFIYNDDKNAVINGFLNQLKQLHRFQITPVYVFDGKANVDVKLVVEKRQMQRAKVQNALDTLGVELEETMEILGDPIAAALVMDKMDTDAMSQNPGNCAVEIPFDQRDIPLFTVDSDDEQYGIMPIEPVASIEETSEDLMQKAVEIQSRILSLQKQVRRPTREMVDDCKTLFTILGVPFVQSPGESDPTLAEMCLSGEVFGVISEDTDMLPYGCQVFITDFNVKSDEITEYKLDSILADIKMEREQFVDLCILCGCDYADKIYKIAVKGALDKIRAYNNIEGVLEWIQSKQALMERHTYPDNFMDQVTQARNMFLTRTPNGEENVEALNAPRPDHVWNIAGVDQANYVKFMADHGVPYGPYSSLVKPWTVAAKSQKTLLDYYAKK